MANSTISSWVLNCIEPKLRTNAAYTDTAKVMSDTLNKRYAVANILKVHQLKTSMAQCNNGGFGMVEFFSKISDL